LRTVRTRIVNPLGCDDGCVRILLIEDDRRLAELLVKRLRAEGHHAETCDDGIGGLAVAETGAFELAIVDVMLPGMP
jgi:DNA-binding response OmpR family regulator